tara:strand:- start:1396 stop:1674 length:279 start_codon:yes stop_codon:yes gene_type:complete
MKLEIGCYPYTERCKTLETNFIKNIFLIIALLLTSTLSFSQTEKKRDISMTSDYSSDNTEISDILQFEGIEYLKLQFKGKDLADKSYHLTVK